MIYLGCRHCEKWSNSHQKLVFRYTLCFVLLLITGVGSWMFHMTLLYEMQLMDELPMVWGASYFVYCQFRVCVINVLMTAEKSLLNIIDWYYEKESTLIYFLLHLRPTIHTKMEDVGWQLLWHATHCWSQLST